MISDQKAIRRTSPALGFRLEECLGLPKLRSERAAMASTGLRGGTYCVILVLVDEAVDAKHQWAIMDGVLPLHVEGLYPRERQVRVHDALVGLSVSGHSRNSFGGVVTV